MSMGMWVNEGTPTISFVLYTCLCDASYVTWKYRQYRSHHVIFVRKYKTFQKINISGPDWIEVAPIFFIKLTKCKLWITVCVHWSGSFTIKLIVSNQVTKIMSFTGTVWLL